MDGREECWDVFVVVDGSGLVTCMCVAEMKREMHCFEEEEEGSVNKVP